MRMPVAPSPPSVRPPSNPEDVNGYSDFYRDVWGLDSIPVSTIDKNLEKPNKRVKWFADWFDYKNEPMSREKIQEFKTHPHYSYNKLQGLGLIIGQIKYGPNKGLWINMFDGDNEKGKEGILETLGYPSVNELKLDCVVEQHPSAPNKFHVYVLSEVPFANFTLSTETQKIKKNEIAGIEIKGEGSGLAYPTPSVYAADIGKETGERYQQVEGSTPVPVRLFTERDVAACEKRLDEVARRYGNASYGKKPVSELLDPDFRVTEGNNRKRYIIQIGMHYLHEFEGDKDKAEKKIKEWNEKHCVPPLTYEAGGKFEDAWDWAKYYYERDGKKTKKSEESKKEQKIKLTKKLFDDEEKQIVWFHDETHTGYMCIKLKDHYEIFRISRKNGRFRLFVRKIYHEATGGGTLKDEELNDIIQDLESRALFSDNVKKVHLRKAWGVKAINPETFEEDVDKDLIFYDLCTPDWKCIMVDGKNATWHVLPFHPDNQIFYRYGQLPQVIPKKSSEYKEDNILDFWLIKMRVLDEKSRLLAKVWIVGGLVPEEPHPLQIPNGPPGAGKTALCKQELELIDPYIGGALDIPDSKKEALLQAHHRMLLVYDNVGYDAPKWFSDLVCELITGIATSKRTLYTEEDDTLFYLKKSVICNGLQVPNIKADAKDRLIELRMEAIPEAERKLQAEIDTWFQENKPKILGKMFDTLALSLKIYPTVNLTKYPRMADFTKRGVSIARALAKDDDEADKLQEMFVNAYNELIQKQNLDVIEENSIADALVKWIYQFLEAGKEAKIDEHPETGSEVYRTKGVVYYPTSMLLSIINMKAQQIGFGTKDKDWPKKAANFVKEIKTVAQEIRRVHGIQIRFDRNSSTNLSQTEIRNLKHENDKKDPDNNGDKRKRNGGSSCGAVGGTAPHQQSEGEQESRTDFSTRWGNFSEITSETSAPPKTQNSHSKIEENSGGATNVTSEDSAFTSEIQSSMQVSGGGDSKSLEVSSVTPPTKISKNYAQNRELRRDGGSGGNFQKLSFFSTEDSSKNLSHPSLIDDIKRYGVAVDPEWDNRPGMDDMMLQFNFYDSSGNNWVLNAVRDFDGSESKLLDAAEDTIRKYKVVLTYFEKGENMGFSKWHKRALALGKVSPINMGNRKDGKDAYISLANHNRDPLKDIDLGQVYEKPIIENFLENIYLSNELDEVAKALLGYGKLDGISGEHFAELPLDKQIEYGMRDAELTYKLAGAKNYAVLSVLERIGQMSIGSIYADLVKMCGTGPTQWWASLFKNKFNVEPSPTAIKRKGEGGELKGGHVEDINEIKEYRWVVIFDFRGQYPSIISRYNLCFSTACCDCCKDNPDAKVNTGLYEVDSKGWWFCRQKRGILPMIIDELVAMRDEYKRLMKQAKNDGKTAELAQQYNIMQLACKLMANSLYGVFGEKNFEYGDLRVANTITGYGRSKVIKMGALIEQAYPCLKSIYHDTDSAFIVGLEQKDGEVLDENHPIIQDIVSKCSASEREGGLGLLLEYQKCYKKLMIKASKNYMGLNAATNIIEVKGLVGKKRNQCKLVRDAFEQQREYWKNDVSNDIVGDHIKDIVTRLDNGAVPLELLKEKTTIQNDPWTGYKNEKVPGCVLGRKYNKQKGESTPSYYLARQEKDGNLSFTEDPTRIDYNKYKERLRTALEGILTVRGYDKEQIDALLGLVTTTPAKKNTRHNSTAKELKASNSSTQGKLMID